MLNFKQNKFYLLQYFNVICVVSKFHDDFLQLLWPCSVLKLNMQHYLNAFLIETDVIIKLQAFENTWKLNKLKTRGTVVQTSFLSGGGQCLLISVISNTNCWVDKSSVRSKTFSTSCSRIVHDASGGWVCGKGVWGGWRASGQQVFKNVVIPI